MHLHNNNIPIGTYLITSQAELGEERRDEINDGPSEAGVLKKPNPRIDVESSSLCRGEEEELLLKITRLLNELVLRFFRGPQFIGGDQSRNVARRPYRDSQRVRQNWQSPLRQRFAAELDEKNRRDSDEHSSEKSRGRELSGEYSWDRFVVELLVSLLYARHLKRRRFE